METLAERLQVSRVAGELTQMEAAKRLGVDKSLISRWETGSMAPSLERVEAMVELYGFDRSVKAWVAFGGAVPRECAKAVRLLKEKRDARARKQKRSAA